MTKRQKNESLASIASLIGCSRPSIEQLKGKFPEDFPRRRGRGYRVREVVDFLIAHAPSGMGVHRAALAYRAQLEIEGQQAAGPEGDALPTLVAKVSAPSEPLPPLPPSPQESIRFSGSPEAPLPDDESAFGEILRQFRAAIVETAGFYRTAVADQNTSAAAFFLAQWNKTFDTLRRAESSVLDIDLQRGRQIQRDEAVALVVAMVANVRSKLLALPAKLSHELSGRTPGQVAKILDEEIRDALECLSEDPFGAS